MIYTKIYDTFWKDKDIRTLSEGAKLTYLYLLTCSHRSSAGLYEIPFVYISHDMDLSGENVKARMKELINHEFIQYDFENEVVFIPKFLTYNALDSSKVEISAAKRLECIVETALFSNFLNNLRENYPQYNTLYDRVYDRVCDTLCDTTNNVELRTRTKESELSNDNSSLSVAGRNNGEKTSEQPLPFVQIEDRPPLEEVISGFSDVPDLAEDGPGFEDDIPGPSPPDLKPKKKQRLDHGSVDAVFDAYDSLCPNLVKCAKRTESRRKKVRLLLRTYTGEEIADAFRRMNASLLCRGKKPNLEHPNWKADIDFCIREDKVANALEGKYDDKAVVEADYVYV